VILQPRFAAGQTLRYHLSLESSSTSKSSGSVRDPEGPAQLDVTWDATVRIEITQAEGGVSSAPSVAANSLHLRITYESSEAEIRSDTPEPRAEQIQQQYAQLAGQSLDFTINASGQVTDIRGLEKFVNDEPVRAAAQKWIEQLSGATGSPKGGIIPGQKWFSIEPADLPLAGRSWRTDFTYLRNAPCRQSSTQGGAGSKSLSDPAQCAVIHSSLALMTTKSMRDATPETYKNQQLRTSGRWSGSGEGQMYVSLDSGWIISSTQGSTEEMDVAIGPAPKKDAKDAAPLVRQAGQSKTVLNLYLLPDGSSPVAKSGSPTH
jgi:hypothetical protein